MLVLPIAAAEACIVVGAWIITGIVMVLLFLMLALALCSLGSMTTMMLVLVSTDVFAK